MRISNKLKFAPFYFISSAPMFILYIISDLMFIIIYYVLKYRKSVVYKNLKSSFPNKTSEELKEIEKHFYQHFCDLIIESIKALTIKPEHLKKRLHIRNPEVIQDLYTKNKSIVLYTAHFGNWEWLSILPQLIPHSTYALYQPLSNNYFDDLIKQIPQRFGTNCIKSKKGYRTLLTNCKNNVLSFNIIIGDQCPGIESPKYWTNFLNQKTAFLIGTERIVTQTKLETIYPLIKKTKRGYYEIEFFKINTDASMQASLTETYSKLLQNSININPALWLWSHRRWKLTR